VRVEVTVSQEGSSTAHPARSVSALADVFMRPLRTRARITYAIFLFGKTE